MSKVELDGQDGSSDAAVYRRNADDLVRFATVLVGPDDAQDVVSSAFGRCMASRQWDDVIDRRAYLFRAVSNEAKNLKRSAARRRHREQAAPIERTIEVSIPRPDVRAAIEDLSVRQRAVVYLTYWHDMSEAMVAAHLGVSAGTVRRHLDRARKKLREVLDE
ncbi:MAG: RNA polymerase sigma factor [Acidimicrobiia bacterium]